MLFTNLEPDAETFTDETSRENKEKTARRVWTHAQIPRIFQLDWLMDLKTLFPDHRPELKSRDLIKVFEKLSRDLRMRVFVGVKKARIHIVDTFSYQAEYKQTLRDVFKYDYEKVLRTEQDKKLAHLIIEGMENFISTLIIFDSPAQRLERSLEARRLGGYGFYVTLDKENRHKKKLTTDLDPFTKGRKKSYDVASKWVSKSGAIFSEALEYSEKFIWGGEYEARQRVSEILHKTHAFDEGDDASIVWLEEQRDHFLEPRFYQSKTLYGKVDSKSSPRIQAADIAARLAQNYYDERGLEGVFDKFEYVTFNGERITEFNLKDRLYYWKQIVEREDRIQQLQDGK